MKYSLRSLMIVVTLAGIASGLFARSRHCAERAAFHRAKLPVPAYCGKSEEELPPADWLAFHKESTAVYQRVARMPWLPLMLPQPPAPVDSAKELEKQQALDALRDKLAKEAREKYGVP